MGRSRRELQRRQSRRGEQQESKFCHDGLGSRKVLDGRFRFLMDCFWRDLSSTPTINKQALGRIVAAFK
jgi:hypothetical protein